MTLDLPEMLDNKTCTPWANHKEISTRMYTIIAAWLAEVTQKLSISQGVTAHSVLLLHKYLCKTSGLKRKALGAVGSSALFISSALYSDGVDADFLVQVCDSAYTKEVLHSFVWHILSVLGGDVWMRERHTGRIVDARTRMTAEDKHSIFGTIALSQLVSYEHMFGTDLRRVDTWDHWPETAKNLAERFVELDSTFEPVAAVVSKIAEHPQSLRLALSIDDILLGVNDNLNSGNGLERVRDLSFRFRVPLRRLPSCSGIPQLRADTFYSSKRSSPSVEGGCQKDDDGCLRFDGNPLEPTRGLQVVGTGGTGTVFSNKKKQTAIKCMAFDDDSIEDAVRELAASAVLHHPNICAPTCARRNNHEMQFTMPLARSSLSRHVHSIIIKEGNSAYKDWLGVWHKHIIYALCRALKHMHDKGIAHRDLKMSNLLVVSGNWDLQSIEALTAHLPLQVCDFGSCQAHNAHAVGSTHPLTFTNWKGTITYRSPETVLGCDESDLVATDVWGVGFISLALFAGYRQRLEKINDVATLLFHPQQGICGKTFCRSGWAKAKDKSVVDNICSWQKRIESGDPNKRLEIDNSGGDIEILEGWFSVVDNYKNSKDPLATFIYERVLSVHPDDRCTIDDILNFIKPPPLNDSVAAADSNTVAADSNTTTGNGVTAADSNSAITNTAAANNSTTAANNGVTAANNGATTANNRTTTNNTAGNTTDNGTTAEDNSTTTNNTAGNTTDNGTTAANNRGTAANNRGTAADNSTTTNNT